MNPGPIDTAMVMSAGLGTRMLPLTANTPKPLIRVSDKALIDYTLDELSAGGVTRIVANVHYCADQLEAHLSDRHDHTIMISDERDELLETGGGLVKARPLIGSGPFFCANTDAIFTGPPTGTACEILRSTWHDDMLALLLLVPLKSTLGFDGNGDFHLDADGHLTKSVGEPAPFAFTGLQILHPGLLDDMPPGAFSTRLIWQKAERTGQLYGAVFGGNWLHVGTPESVADAEQVLRKMALPAEDIP